MFQDKTRFSSFLLIRMGVPNMKTANNKVLKESSLTEDINDRNTNY